MRRARRSAPLRAALLGLLAATAAPLAGAAASIVIQVGDGPGEGLNDPTPFTPIGGNAATTLGEARRRVLEEAARVWGELLNSSITIKVQARFDPLNCTATTAALGTAGPTLGYRDFPGAPVPGVIYPSALADALTNTDIAELSTQTAGSADIAATFNSSLDSDPTCLGGRRFYYGLDHRLDQNGDGIREYAADLLRVVLHELAHGLGFVSIVNPATGESPLGSDGVRRVAIFDEFVFDETTALGWSQMTAAQRAQAARNTGNLAWNGARVNARRNRLTAGVTSGGRVRLYAPPAGSPGGAVSHWDVAARPDLLMEPFETGVPSKSTDLTTCMLADIGWSVASGRCPDSPNGRPVATAQTVTGTEDTARSIVLAGSDPDRDPIRFSVATNPARGTLSGTAPNLTYTPNANANGTDSFTFTVADDFDGSAPATVTVQVEAVNDAPQATARAASVTSGQATTIALEGSDVDGDVLTFQLVSTPASGQVTLSGASATYTSNAGFSGSDSFTFRVNDGSVSSAAATVSITVNAPPPPAGGGSGGGGGGGATSPGVLLGLLAALWAANRGRDGSPRGEPFPQGPRARRRSSDGASASNGTVRSTTWAAVPSMTRQPEGVEDAPAAIAAAASTGTGIATAVAGATPCAGRTASAG